MSCGCSSRMRAPIRVGVRKSSGVPATGTSSPVGVRLRSTSVNRLCVHLENLVFDGSGAFAGEVPIGVVREIDDGRTIRFSAVVDAQFASLVEEVGNVGPEIARVTLFAIRTEARQT